MKFITIILLCFPLYVTLAFGQCYQLNAFTLFRPFTEGYIVTNSDTIVCNVLDKVGFYNTIKYRLPRENKVRKIDISDVRMIKCKSGEYKRMAFEDKLYLLVTIVKGTVSLYSRVGFAETTVAFDSQGMAYQTKKYNVEPEFFLIKGETCVKPHWDTIQKDIMTLMGDCPEIVKFLNARKWYQAKTYDDITLKFLVKKYNLWIDGNK